VSSPTAIATVTATLRHLIAQGVAADPDLADTIVTTLPMDKARSDANNPNQINLFLYQTLPNAAWRNADMPRQVRPGETAPPPLALNLYYLVTAYGRDNDIQLPFSHVLMGRAMLVLHDHPLLGTEELRAALPRNDLFAQVERVRVTLQPLSVEDIFKLWSGFQTQYRLSAAYEASVVLIESERGVRTPLPVLSRGQKDAGVLSQADVQTPFPTIQKVAAPNQQASGQPGDLLTISGTHLDGDKVVVVFTSPRATTPIRIEAPAASATASQVVVVLDRNAAWIPGPYAVAVEITSRPGKKDQQVRSTNESWFTLAPSIAGPFPLKATRKQGDATIVVTCSPPVQAEQRVTLLLDSREIVAEPYAAPATSLTFVVTTASAGSFLVRLRVDGVDSLLVDASTTPATFKDERVVIK
jgi:hypothetical protein